jgi:hypothetical protein
MSSRATVTIVLAAVLMVLIMGVAAMLTFGGSGDRAKWTASEGWAQPAAGVASMKITNLTGVGKTDLFVQAGNSLLVFDASGAQAFRQDFPGTLASSLADVDGDDIQEMLAYYAGESGSVVAALRATDDGRTVWQTDVLGLNMVGRAAVIDLAGMGRSGLVIADLYGQVVAISDKGEELWRYDAQFDSDLRGLDNILVGKSQLAAAADLNGQVIALDSKGQPAWTFDVPGGLRRLRTEELMGPGKSAVLLGGEDGTLYVLDGSTGQELWTADLGQAIAEIRLAELDGDPGTRELVIGGTRNGVWGYSQAGERLFTASIGGEKTKVTEIAAMDVEGSGRDTVAIGDEYGVVTFFNATGDKLFERTYEAPINRMTTGKLLGERQFLVADASQVRGILPQVKHAPFWYSPLLAGLLACILIAGVAYFLASMKPAPALQLSAEEMSVEAQKARRIMLHESINDLKRMKEGGEVPPEAYLTRLKDLRGQLADAEANLIRLGVPLKAETITCPHCGGSLELGTDRCEYCGQTVLV